MSRKRASLLLAVVAVGSLPLAQPAQSLLEPEWDCGFVAIRDFWSSSGYRSWLFVEYAWFAGVPGVHTDVKVTCWAQHSATYTGTLTGGAATSPTNSYTECYSCWPPPSGPTGGTILANAVITCTASPPASSTVCVEPDPLSIGQFYEHESGSPYWYCEHVVWTDTATGQTFTRRTSPCAEV